MNLGRGMMLAAMPSAGIAADFPAPPSGASSRIDAIRQRGSLRVAVLDEYPWLKQNAGGGEPFRGPAWRLAKEYARRLGVRIETVPVGFGDKVSIVSSGRVDITIAPLLVTPERVKVVDFIPYSMSAQCLFGRADNPKVARAGQVDDLNRRDVTIAIITGSPQGAWLQKRLPAAAVRSVPDSLADVPVTEILSRRVDVGTIDKFFFTGLARNTPGLASVPRGDACLKSRELPIPVGMAINKRQPVFLAWLRMIAVAIKPWIDAAEADVEKVGR